MGWSKYYNVVTSLWQACDKHDIVVTRLQGTCESIAWLDKVVTRLSQGCHKLVTCCKDSTTLPRPCHFCMEGLYRIFIFGEGGKLDTILFVGGKLVS